MSQSHVLPLMTLHALIPIACYLCDLLTTHHLIVQDHPASKKHSILLFPTPPHPKQISLVAPAAANASDSTPASAFDEPAGVSVLLKDIRAGGAGANLEGVSFTDTGTCLRVLS